ncbi:N-acetyl-1-D-myo-inositol-2-amino-2-deoxy-alpha-D-glucopyranoside deacetylase [Saxibacter everestensis]|uniref:N-acetyl-1-D-myo-inositol-2-amino-2-deoxy-alpha-D-glucopyranoside deacetylase n=1 Tax=Saxibacter everestensis TaxID=2909229 RepID=A0ABY8QNL8_9MICO|nr:N-acetyl-1-D-myo-inositol-2-amino-2-deoxy-alpha-D-glucopyranoside deacetylase [Brevibacteriaceae bacterium ZFBP1038]
MASQVPRLLFVHAHPDDETITTGGTMARAVADGAAVTLVTCTRGELGEVIPAELAQLQAPATEAERRASGNHGDRLAEHREGELAAAMAVLGVTDHRFLGDVYGEDDLTPRRFRDSGMVWGRSGHAEAPAEMHPDALCNAPIAEAAGYLERIIREVRPHVVVSYNIHGGYGHPDHVRAQQITMAAIEAAAKSFQKQPGWPVPKVYQIDTPESELRADFDPGQPGFAETGFSPVEAIPITPTPDHEVTTAVDIDAFVGAKALALSRHATQVSVIGQFMALSNRIGQRIADVEYFRLVRGTPGPANGSDGRETSLIAGLELADGALSDDALSGVSRSGASPDGAIHTGSAGSDYLAEERIEMSARQRGIIGYLTALVLGLIVAITGTLQHLSYLMVGGSMLPVGLVLSLLLVISSQVYVAAFSRRTGPAMLIGTMCFVAAFVFSQTTFSPGGSYLVASNLRGLGWLVLPAAITAVMAFVLPKRLRRLEG